jgi:hypothetical protein
MGFQGQAYHVRDDEEIWICKIPLNPPLRKGDVCVADFSPAARNYAGESMTGGRALMIFSLWSGSLHFLEPSAYRR